MGELCLSVCTHVVVEGSAVGIGNSGIGSGGGGRGPTGGGCSCSHPRLRCDAAAPELQHDPARPGPARRSSACRLSTHCLPTLAPTPQPTPPTTLHPPPCPTLPACAREQEERTQLRNRERAMQLLRSKLFDMELERQRSEIAQRRKSQARPAPPRPAPPRLCPALPKSTQFLHSFCTVDAHAAACVARCACCACAVVAALIQLCFGAAAVPPGAGRHAPRRPQPAARRCTCTVAPLLGSLLDWPAWTGTAAVARVPPALPYLVKFISCGCRWGRALAPKRSRPTITRTAAAQVGVWVGGSRR